MKERIKREWEEYQILMRSVPSIIVVFFVISVVLMNLLANKSININLDWLALDCGLIISWMTFLTMDVITKRFGPKAATEISITGVVVNIVFCIILFIASIIPGTWGEAFCENGEAINVALDNTFGGTWYVVLGSTIAFIVSAVINNFTNHFIGKKIEDDGVSFKKYAIRSYVSTFIGQFCDNLTFALIVSHNFFGWSFLQCVTCSLTGAIVELIFEVIFSPMGYKTVKKWEEQNIGIDYLTYTSKNE